MAQNSNLYTGTLIFCIIAGCITLAILGFFIFLNVEPVKYMLLTIELILILIITHSIITIVLYERSMKKYDSVLGEQPLSGLDCPDYFTRSITDDSNMCENTYSTPKTTLYIGESVEGLIDLTKLRKQSANDTCKEFSTDYSTKIPWTELKSVCETIQ